MEELKLKISETDLFNEDEIKDLFNDIMKIEDEEVRIKLIDEVFKKLHEELLEGVYSSEDKIQESIDRLETLYIENTELNSFQVREYFDDNNIKSNLLAEEILKKVDEEIAQLENELSEEITAANSEGITTVEYIEKEIARLESEKSNEVKYYNELIEKAQTEIDERILLETEEELLDKISRLKNEKIEIVSTVGGYPNLSDEELKRCHDIDNIIDEINQEIDFRKKYEGKSDEDLLNQIAIFENEKEELINRILFNKETLTKKEEERFDELNELLPLLREKVKKNKLKDSQNVNDNEVEEKIQELLRKQKEVQSTYDKRVEELNVKLQKAHRLEELKKFKENFKTKTDNKERKKIENIEKAKKIALKSLIVIGGFGTGLALSSIPGIGVITMTAATVKLAHAAVKLWTKKFPEGKVAKIIDTTKNKFEEKFGIAKDKFDEKFGSKINEFKEKHPNIISKVKMAKDKIKQTLKSKNVNLFINSVSAGYLAGNLVELFTGQTVFEHVGNMFDNDGTSQVIQAADGLTSSNPTVEPTIEPTVPEVTPGIESGSDIIDGVTSGVPEITLEPGGTYDLSGIAEGFVSSDATQPVNLMTGVADDLTFDRIVNGRAHFIQANGQGMAWYDLDQVQEYLAKAAEVAGKVK